MNNAMRNWHFYIFFIVNIETNLRKHSLQTSLKMNNNI